MSGSSNSGRGRGDGQRGGGGRDNNGGRGRTPGGRFVMPTGQAFFTGGSSSSSSAPAPRNGLLIGPSGDINMNVKSENSNQVRFILFYCFILLFYFVWYSSKYLIFLKIINIKNRILMFLKKLM